MHDGIQYNPIQGQGQDHEPFKFRNPAVFKSYFLCHLQSELANDHGFWNQGTISKSVRVGSLIFGLVFVSRDFVVGTNVICVSPRTWLIFTVRINSNFKVSHGLYILNKKDTYPNFRQRLILNKVCCWCYYGNVAEKKKLYISDYENTAKETVFTRSPITPPKVYRFGWNLEQCEPNIVGWPWQIWFFPLIVQFLVSCFRLRLVWGKAQSYLQFCLQYTGMLITLLNFHLHIIIGLECIRNKSW